MTLQVDGPSGGPHTGGPLLLEVDRGLRRNRLTSFFRIILVIPHGIALVGLYLATVVVLVVSWVAALALGRVPDGMHRFLAGVVAYYGRATGYVSLLTDAYPPFTLYRIPAYPVRVTVPRGGRLNRFAVLFRIVLAVPALILNQLLAGVALFIVFAWFAAIFAGRTPRAVHDAIATALRYQLRLYAYLLLLTPTYPWGPLGDEVDRGPGYAPGPPPSYPPAAAPPGYGPPSAPPTASPAPSPVPAPAAPPAATKPATSGPAYPPGYPAGPGGLPAYPPAPYGAPVWGPGADPGADPGPYTGRVTGGARAILIVSLVLGGAQAAGNVTSLGRGGGTFPHFAEGTRISSGERDFDAAVDGTVALCARFPTDCDDEAKALLQQAARDYTARVRTVHGSDARVALLKDLASFRRDVAAADPLVDDVGTVTDSRVLADRDRISDDSRKLERALF